MSKFVESLREIGVCNPHHFYNNGDVYIVYVNVEGRGGYSKSMVRRKGYKTYPNGHWMNNGDKSFTGRKKYSIPEAQEWASQKFGIKEWMRDPFGAYGDAEVVKSRIKELKKLLTNKKDTVNSLHVQSES